jgi:phosphoglycolate phosphatase-like HAD superfamily hydrolase
MKTFITKLGKPKDIHVFDLDGTIVGSTEPSIEAMRVRLLAMNMPRAVTYEFIRSMWGLPFYELVTLICAEAGDVTRVDEFLSVDCEPIEQYKIDLSLIETLWQLQAFNDLYLVTSRKSASLERVGRVLDLNFKMFKSIITPDTWPHIKPSHKVFHGINGISNHAGEIYAFGDTVKFDWEAAKRYNHIYLDLNARHQRSTTTGADGCLSPSASAAYRSNLQSGPIEFVGVASGISTIHQFQQAGVVTTVEDLSGLARYLQERFL